MIRYNELQLCLETYIPYGIKTSVSVTLGSKKSANDFFLNLDRIVFRDNPDAYIKNENTIYIIEHFEYDATQSTKGGSKTRLEEDRINKDLNKKDCKPLSDKYYLTQMDVTHSTIFLKDNFIRHFNNHASKLEQYKNNLIKEKIISDADKVKYIFCCEDKTTFGCLCHDNTSPMKAFSVLDIKECVDEIVKSKLDSIILFNPYQSNHRTFFTDIKAIDPNSTRLKKAEEIQIIDFKPNVLAASIFIPTEKLNK